MAVDDRRRLEQVLHRVNNLLGTIEIQAEVAQTIGTDEAIVAALEHIVASARRTRDELQQHAAGSRNGTGGAGPSAADGQQA